MKPGPKPLRSMTVPFTRANGTVITIFGYDTTSLPRIFLGERMPAEQARRIAAMVGVRLDALPIQERCS